jgi:hypothetical protein
VTDKGELRMRELHILDSDPRSLSMRWQQVLAVRFRRYTGSRVDIQKMK